MNRMLDAAEAILANKGADALTVENVIAEAKTSMGSFYGRFKNRDGLVAALHQRFLQTVQKEIFSVIQARPAKPNLEADLADFIYNLLKVVTTNRKSFYFFVIGNSFNIKMRREAKKVWALLVAELTKIVKNHKSELKRKNISGEIELATRINYGLFLELVIYENGFVGNGTDSIKKVSKDYAKVIAELFKS